MAITKIEVPELFDFGSDNSAFKLPTGTTAERPTSPSNGEMRFNTTTGYVEYYDTTDTQWWEIDYTPDPIVPSENFDAVLYTGGSQQTISLSFEPDFIWLKSRGGSYGHMLFDSVRGIDLPNDYYVQSNTSAAQITSTNRFTLNGNSITIPVGSNSINSSAGSPYVMWYWKAGGAAVSNTDGTITSQVSANTDAGFSIVEWTGTEANATIGHGIDTPELIIIKNASAVKNWTVYSSNVGATKYGKLNLTDDFQTASTAFNNTDPTSSVFSVGSASVANGNGNTMIAYCFHSVDGFSKMGSYTGTGATGNTIVTGFEPAYLMTKRTDVSGYNWYIWDNKRSPTNPRDEVLQADTSSAEADYSAYPHDFNSNGFTIDTSSTAFNGSGATYIFMAFAADPT